jgi:hypothetical protein
MNAALQKIRNVQSVAPHGIKGEVIVFTWAIRSAKR